LIRGTDVGADAGSIARDGGPGLALARIRRDASVSSDAGATVLDACEAACAAYVGCGVALDCNRGDATWIEEVCRRECAAGDWAALVDEAPDCIGVVGVAHEVSPTLATACRVDAAVCEVYGSHLVSCIVGLCEAAPAEELTVDLERACLDALLLGEQTEIQVQGVTATPCDDPRLRRAVETFNARELPGVCATRTEPVPLSAETCARACVNAVAVECTPDEPTPADTDLGACVGVCTSDATLAHYYACAVAAVDCPSLDLCREATLPGAPTQGSECAVGCAALADCAGSDDHCEGIDRDNQGAYLRTCFDACPVDLLGSLIQAESCADRVAVAAASEPLDTGCRGVPTSPDVSP